MFLNLAIHFALDTFEAELKKGMYFKVIMCLKQNATLKT